VVVAEEKEGVMRKDVENCCHRCLSDLGRRAKQAPPGPGVSMEMRDAHLVTVAGVPALLCGPCIAALHDYIQTVHAIYTALGFVRWIAGKEGKGD